MECIVSPELLLNKRGDIRKNLFREFNNNYRRAHQAPVYTMKEHDYNGLISAYRVYMDSSDEYEAAMKLFGSWDAFQMYLDMEPFFLGPHQNSRYKYKGVREWRKEKELRDKSEAKKLLWTSAKRGNVTAQKLIYDGDRTAGRPSKSKINEEARKQAEQDKMLQEGLDRIKKIRLISSNENTASASNH